MLGIIHRIQRMRTQSMVLGVMNSHKAKAYEMYTEQHRREGKPVELGLLLRLRQICDYP